MGKYKVKLRSEIIQAGMLQWLRNNVGKSDVDYTITHDLVSFEESGSGFVTHVHFAREEDSVKFILTWL